ncbi:MAG: hypothetical protein DCC68_05315 [Planctomycetota bacterium]|nr:MAG: hypothetical protein DCC68_05315 [Planctomycetota bacterium]
MQNANLKRPKTPRVTRLELPPGLFEAAIDRLQQRDVLLRLGMCVVAAAIMWAVTGAGKRPFPYRIGDTPLRTIVVTYPFSQEDLIKTHQQREVARSAALCVYDNNEDVLVNLREELKNKVAALTAPAVDDKVRTQWQEFYAPPPQAKPAPNPADKAKTPTETLPHAKRATLPVTMPVPAAERASRSTRLPFALVALVDDVKASEPADAPAPANPPESTPQSSPQENADDKAKEPGDTAGAASKTSPAASNEEQTPSAKPDQPEATEPESAEPESKQPETKPPETKQPEPVKPQPPPPPKTAEEIALDQFRAGLGDETQRLEFKNAIDAVFAPLIKHGVMDALPKEHDGNQVHLRVRDGRGETSKFAIGEVLIGDLLPDVERDLSGKISSPFVHDICVDWLRKKLGEVNTLTYNSKLTAQSKEEAAAEVETVKIAYQPGMPLAPAGEPLTPATLALLMLEYNSEQAQPNWYDRAMRSAAVAGMFIALFTLCGFYIAFREPRLISNLARFSLLLTLVTATALLSYALADENGLRAEVIPLMLFGMTIAVAYQQELAMLLSAAVALVVVFLSGFGMTSFVALTATVTVAILLLGRIRSRRKLIYVGLTAGVASALTSLGVHTLTGPAPTLPVVYAALWCGLWGLVAAFLMTGLLPFIENLFGVQTDLSLIELGDVAHPLLQELVRRAPGTYNHSIMVASIAEAAAEAIGAHGLLVRVGAYFHDIGKMLKPGYFVENQGMNGSRHDDLVPAMSTLIIIAHVKDGADLARQHHLPQPIIDFIQQHHGTTLVEYFYGRAAAEQKASDPDRPVDESSFRYPGPKPQTKEAAVLMLADAVESASRSLVEPAPARIESLVHDIAMKRLLDGQFNACGLTLQELYTIEESLVKSLIAVYHGRVKYPGQRTA